VHPTKPILAIAGSEGFYLLWDYLKKELVVHNYLNYENEKPTTMCFTPDGEELLVGTEGAQILVLDPEKDLENKTS
jgi:WD40 repeat protein